MKLPKLQNEVAQLQICFHFLKLLRLLSNIYFEARKGIKTRWDTPIWIWLTRIADFCTRKGTQLLHLRDIYIYRFIYVVFLFVYLWIYMISNWKVVTFWGVATYTSYPLLWPLLDPMSKTFHNFFFIGQILSKNVLERKKHSVCLFSKTFC